MRNNGRRVSASKRAARKRCMVAALKKYGLVSIACKSVGITRKTHYDWIKSDLGYAEAAAEARELFADGLEVEARRRAVSGIEVPVFYRGEQIGTKTRYSDGLLITLLKAARPEVYGNGAQGIGPPKKFDQTASQHRQSVQIAPERQAMLDRLRSIARAAAELPNK